MMRIRKLTKAEHGVTRILWEEVFTEDEDAFLDYYYEVKATENTIYVIEDDAGDPLSMLQLNPYSVRFGKKDRTLHYVYHEHPSSHLSQSSGSVQTPEPYRFHHICKP